MSLYVFLKSSVSMTKMPSESPGFWALNRSKKTVSDFAVRDPSLGSMVHSAPVPATKAARKSANPMNSFCMIQNKKNRECERCMRKCLNISSIFDCNNLYQTYLESEFFHSSRAVQARFKFNRGSEVAGGNCAKSFFEVEVLKYH
jgi:hypothetical protein